MSVYAGVKVGRVYKLSKTDLSIEAYSDDFREDPYGGIGKVVSDGDYIYANVQVRVFEIPGDPNSPLQLIAKVFKLNKNNLSKITESANFKNIHGVAMMIDSEYIYIGATPGVTGYGRVYKLDASDLSTIAQSIEYTGFIYVIASDNNYLYIGGYDDNPYVTETRIWKLQKSNLAKVAESTLYPSYIYGIALNDNYLYIGGGHGTSDTKVWKLNKSNLTKVRESAVTSNFINGIALRNDFIYVANTTLGGVGRVWKLKISDLVKIAENTDYGAGVYEIVTDNTHSFIGGSGSIGKVWKLNNSDLTKVTESSNISAIGGLTFAEAIPPPPPPLEKDYAFIM